MLSASNGGHKGGNKFGLNIGTPGAESFDSNKSYEIGSQELNLGKEGYVIGQSGMRKKGATDNVGGTITAEDVVLGRILGKGACGMVYEARLKSTNTLVAIKTINVYDKERRHQLINDLRSLSNHKCPFLINFHGALYEEG
jgi:mitogen-activated protein kinase kinase 3